MSEEAKITDIDQSQHTATVSRRSFLRSAVIGGVVGAELWNKLGAAEPRQHDKDINTRLFTFIGGQVGPWSIVTVKTIIGEALPSVARLDMVNGPVNVFPDGAKWFLRGVTSNTRYTTRQEKDQLGAKQPSLGRPTATCAALIPVRKNAQWWSLPQDQRREIFEERSHHIKTGLEYLPAVARRLHHCRDLGENEPFDFLTWFEYAKADAAAFDELVARLRTTEEWTYVDREIDMRLVRV
jgi:hypothetical protein